MRRALIFSYLVILGMTQFFAQSFFNGASQLPNSFHSGGCVGFTDMDGDGFDDIIVLDLSQNLHVLYQGPDGLFSDTDLGSVSVSNQWGMCVADFDNDGHKDVFSGGSYDGVHVKKITSPGEFTTIELQNGSMFMQGCNWADINNDGYLDIFACHDDGVSRMWTGSLGGALTPAPALMPLENYLLANYPGNDHSGNYGSVFCDFDNDGDLDLFIAKCRQFINDPNDPRRINQLWVNDGAGNFTEEANERGLVIYEQSWTVDFADIDNDGDFDCLVTTHSSTLMLFENDGLGYFTDITPGSGLEVGGFFLQAKMEDFDNDGYVDLIHSGGTHGYFHNNGDQTFTEVAGVFPANDVMHSFAFGDANRDGSMDLYASYGGGYVDPDLLHEDILWINEGNSNNWITFNLEGFQSNIDAVGAVVVISGDFGTQIREVRSGESYGITCTFSCHFGLGLSALVDSAVIKWPSGLETVILNPEINQFHSINEAPCIIDVAIETGAYGFCPGDSVIIHGPLGFETYQWSNGVSGNSSLTVNSGGNYSLLVTDINGCAGNSNIVSIIEVTGQAPTIEVEGELTLCEGGVVVLTASDAAAWVWSTADTTSSISISTSGIYYVHIEDICGNSSVSEDYNVVVYDGPAGPPILSGNVPLSDPGIATLEAIGENIKWYDAEIGGELLFEGAVYLTPYLESSSMFWASSTHITSGDLVSGGEMVTQTTGQYHPNSNRWLEFDALEDMLIRSVTVYANGSYDRTIELIDEFGNVLNSKTVFIEDGQFVVNLDFEVPAGVGFGLRSVTDNPQLWREGTSSSLSYPYPLGSIGFITNCTAGPEFSYYYFFYDWQVEPLPIYCESDRASIDVIVTGIDELNFYSPEFFPNPALKNSTLQFANLPTQPYEIELTDLQGRIVMVTRVKELHLNNLDAGTYQVTVRQLSNSAIIGSSRLIIQ